jgi:hypothetical protein
VREFVILWAALIVNFWIGFAMGKADERRRAARRRDPLKFPEHLPPEFKAWLHDYIAVNLR